MEALGSESELAEGSEPVWAQAVDRESESELAEGSELVWAQAVDPESESE